MVKRMGRVWEEITSLENLEKAYLSARRGRRGREEVIEFEKDVRGNLNLIRDMLISGTYKSSNYHNFKIIDRGKERNISSLPFFPDRIVHWAVMIPTSERFINSFISQTYSAIPNRGTHKALHTLKSYLKSPDAKYCLKIDVHHFFQNINKDILVEKLSRVFKDKHLMNLFKEIIYGYNNGGIPIGNYTSQYFANIYLSEIDHYMKEVYHCKYYLRYMDDIIILGWDKKWLHRVFNKLEDMLSKIGLTIKDDWQIFPISDRGVDFVGYRCFSHYTLLRKRTKVKLRRKMSSIVAHINESKEVSEKERGCYHAYCGILQWCDSYRLCSKTIEIVAQHLYPYAD